MGGAALIYERCNVLLEKFVKFKERVSNESELLEQELLKYVEQLDFDLKEQVLRKSGPKIENLDIRNFRKLMRSAQKSCASMVDAIYSQSLELQSALPKVKSQKQKKKKPKKKQVKGSEDDESFLDAIIEKNSIDQALHDKMQVELEDKARAEEAKKKEQLKQRKDNIKVNGLNIKHIDEIKQLYDKRLNQLALLKS